MDNIIIVCDDKAVSETLKSNLMLLRKFDTAFSCDFLSAKENILRNLPKLIIYYSPVTDENVLDFINNMKEIPILFVTEELSDEDIVSVYEAGVSDYITTAQSQTEFLVKTMLCLKKSTETKKLLNYSDILQKIGIIEKNNEFYLPKYTKAIFKSLIKKYVDNGVSTIIMAIAPDINMKNDCPDERLANILKLNLREEDVIAFGKDNLYVLLPNTNQQGALEVYNKIKKNISSTICAGILQIEKDMKTDFIFQKVDEALSDALSVKNTAVVQEDLTKAMNWLDKPNKKHKNFKLFKKVFLKKLETVITPVFYQKQQMAEQRLFEVEINQFCDEKKSIFSLKKDNKLSLFEITYPGAVKINIDIFKNINDSDIPKRLSFELSELNEKMLGDLLDKFIRDFQKTDK